METFHNVLWSFPNNELWSSHVKLVPMNLIRNIHQFWQSQWAVVPRNPSIFNQITYSISHEICTQFCCALIEVVVWVSFLGGWHSVFTHILYGCFQDDVVIKWKHFSRYWPSVRGIHRSPVNSPHKGQWRWWSFGVFFDLRLNKRWSKQSCSWWFEMPSRPLWRHWNWCKVALLPVK